MDVGEHIEKKEIFHPKTSPSSQAPQEKRMDTDCEAYTSAQITQISMPNPEN